MNDNSKYDPDHYTSESIESVEVIEAFFRHDSHLATAYAYLHRAGKKPDNPPVEDYNKALWWLRRAADHPLRGAKATDDDRDVIDLTLAARIINEVYPGRPRIGAAFHCLVTAVRDITQYKGCVRDAVSWIREEVAELNRGNQGV